MKRLAISQFVQDSSLRNAWCQHGPIRLYLRQGPRTIPGDTIRHNVIDLAALESTKPGSGQLEEAIKVLEEEAKQHNIEGILAENVVNERLCHWLERRGYALIVPRGSALPNYYKELA